VIVISKGMKNKIMDICTHILASSNGHTRPIDSHEWDRITNHYHKVVANNMKGLFFSHKVMTRKEYNAIKARYVNPTILKNGKYNIKYNDGKFVNELEKNSTLVATIGLKDPTKKNVQVL
jgi:magnesium-transporting ATPase (P-type)